MTGTKHTNKDQKEYTFLSPEWHRNIMLNIVQVDDLIAMDFPDPEYLIEPLILKNGINMIAGQPGSGKTWIALDIARSLTLGKTFLDHFAVKPCAVLYIDEECGFRLLRWRAMALQRDNTPHPGYSMMGIKGVKLDDYSHEIAPTIKDLKRLQETEGASSQGIQRDTRRRFSVWLPRLESILKKLSEQTDQPLLVIIDPLVAAMEGDENSATDSRKVRATLQRFTNRPDLDVTFLVLHHTNKSVTSAGLSVIRGSTELVGMLSNALVIYKKKEENIFHVRQLKIRHGQKEPLFMIRLVSEDDYHFHLEYAEATDERISEPTKPERTQEALGVWIERDNVTQFKTKDAEKATKAALGNDWQRNALYAALEALCERGDISKPKRGQYEVIRESARTTSSFTK